MLMMVNIILMSVGLENGPLDGIENAFLVMSKCIYKQL